jgi:hypothetical protein
MAKGKTSSKSDTNYYSRYQSNKVWETNRKRKLNRHIKTHPGDECAKRALGAIKYRRKTPKDPQWTPGKIKVAMLFKEFAGHVNKDIFNSNQKIQQDALLSYSRGGRGAVSRVNQTSRVDFSIGARAHDNQGRPWIS